MKDKLETAMMVLNWRSRSVWVLAIGMIVSVIVSMILDANLENYAATSTNMSKMMLPALTIFYNVLNILVAIAPFAFAGIYFCKDWKEFHRRW